MIEGKQAQTDIELMKEIATRWSPRAFSDKPVEEEKLLRMFEAARWAPSSSNGQPWHFIIARKGDAHYNKLFEGVNEGNQKWAWSAPVVGVSLAQKRFDYKNRENRHYMHDVGMAMGNLLTQATHDGLYVHQMGGIIPEKIYTNFEVDEDKYEVVAMFVIGYQDESRLDEMDEKFRESEMKPRERRALKDFLFAGKFGENPEWI
tara:strand:- start:841 stop:1452 length:612 start_codon:yes stop_codon:yes gene_type:complete